jgi:hypothetical protein
LKMKEHAKKQEAAKQLYVWEVPSTRT